MNPLETYLFHTLDKMHAIASILLVFMAVATGILFFTYIFGIATPYDDDDKIISSIRKITILSVIITAVLIVAVVVVPDGYEFKEIMNGSMDSEQK